MPKNHKDAYPGSPEKTRDSLFPKLTLRPWKRADPPSLVLRNAQVIDADNSCLLQGLHDVSTENGHVVSITPSAEWKGQAAGDAVVVDIGGKFLCPGLIDCHVHITAVPGVRDISEFTKTPNEVIHLRSTYVLRETLLRGFTTVRDTGGASRALADAITEGLVIGPRLIQCGKSLSQTGGHSDFLPPGGGDSCCGGHSKISGLGRICDGVPEVLKAVREELKSGADFIKIMCGGGVASPTDAIETVQFTAEEIRAITTTCKQMGGKQTTAHAYTDEAVRHAVENGVGGIEHGNLISLETAQMMAEKGIFLTPTLACYGAMARPPFEHFLSPELQVKNEQVAKQGLKALENADKAGVTICFGSDLLNSLQALQTEEFTVRSAVLPAAKILKHATTNASLLLRDDKIGRIKVGGFADMLILDANPLDDIKVLDYPEDHLFAVIKAGRVFSSRVAGLVAEAML